MVPTLSSGRHFLSDNASGAHPRVLEAMVSANQGHEAAYGNDRFSDRARSRFREIFGDDTQIHWCFGGTGANVMALASVLRFHDAVVCANTAHIVDSETGAPERVLGAKLIAAPTVGGKMSPETLEPLLADPGSVHAVRPRILSVTQATEFGTVYSAEELRELCACGHRAGVLVHLDGARIANAAAALGLGLRAATRDLGVDILSFGGTKNGLVSAESVLFFGDHVAPEAGAVLKQVTQLPSKSRFIAAQYCAYLEDELWREMAVHANRCARRLADGFETLEGYALHAPADANMVLVESSAERLQRLKKRVAFHFWNRDCTVARMVCSFDHSEADISETLEFAARLSDVHREA
ncbi:MAG: beta-eliminating lyase-related protein [Myxococcota bacterium]